MSNVGTAQGSMEERKFVISFNKGHFTEFLNENFSDPASIFAVHVTTKQYSKLSRQQVLPKADAYLVRISHIPTVHFQQNDYYLSESDLENLRYEVIEGSGITIKRPDSRSFQYHKFPVNTFVTAFGDACLGAGASMYIQEKDANKNTKVMKLWGVTEDEFVSYFCGKLNLELDEWRLSFRLIQEWSLRTIKERILNDSLLQDIVFSGRGVFDSPYYVSYSFFDGKMSNELFKDFYVTQGSGRTTSPTIVIKPK